MAEQNIVAEKVEKKEVVAPNPYNAKKEYSDGRSEVPRGLMGVNDGRATDTREQSAPGRGEAPVNEQATTEARPQTYEQVDYKKRYDDLKRHYDEKINEFKQRESEFKSKLSKNKPDYSPPKTPEELATFRKEHPDIYEVAETVAYQRTQEEVRELKEKLESMEEEKTQVLRGRAEAELRSLHPDFEELRESQEFQRWAMNQGEEIQNWLFRNSTNAKLTARAIDLYKLDAGILTHDQVMPKENTQTKRQPDAAEAVVVRNQGEVTPQTPKIWKASDIRRMKLPEYESYKDDIWKAYQEGRVVND